MFAVSIAIVGEPLRRSQAVSWRRAVVDLSLRTCPSCGIAKSVRDFSFADVERGKLSWQCRMCHAEARRHHYLANRDDYVRRAIRQITRRRAENRERIHAYLLAHPCVDCGATDPVVLDFDHRDPKKKKREVAWLAARRSWQVVMAEIEKCDVRCANCHRRRTALQFGWSKSAVKAIIETAGPPQSA